MPQIHLWKISAHLLGICPCTRPSRAAASSCRTLTTPLSRHVPGLDPSVQLPCGHSMTHRNLLPVRSGTPAMRPSLSQRSYIADSLSNNRRSTLWKLRRTLPVRLRIIRGLPVLNQAADESSLTVFSIYKFQKIVNTVKEIFSGVDCKNKLHGKKD